MGWIPCFDNSLYWVEAQDGGDPRIETEIRDKLFSLSAPFNKENIKTIQSFSLRFYDCDWSNYGFAWTQERFWKTRWSKTYKIEYEDSNFEKINQNLIFDRSYEDSYNSPGSIWKNTGDYVFPVFDNNKILLESVGATPNGYLPFLRQFDTDLKESKEIWRCKEGEYERIQVILEDDGSSFITKRESNSDQPNLWLYYKNNDEILKSIKISNFPNPYPWMDTIKRELVTYERDDGVLLSGTLLLPSNFTEGTDEPLPMVISFSY